MIKKITLPEATTLLATRLNSEKFLAATPVEQQAYLDIAYGYLTFLDLTIPDPTPQCVIDAQAIMASWDIHNGISVTTKSGGEIIEAKVASIAVKYAEGTNTSTNVNRIPMEAYWCLANYGYSANNCKIRQCKIGRA